MTLESSGEHVCEAFTTGGFDARPLRSASDSLSGCVRPGRSLRALLGLLLLLLLGMWLLSLFTFLLSLRFRVTSAGDSRPARLLPRVRPVLPHRDQRGGIAGYSLHRSLGGRIVIMVSSGRSRHRQHCSRQCTG